MRGRLGEQVLAAFSQTKTRPLPTSISNSSASPFTLSPFNRATFNECSFPPLFPDSASNSKTHFAPSSAQLFTSFPRLSRSQLTITVAPVSFNLLANTSYCFQNSFALPFLLPNQSI